jgi:hypothetical protein
MYPVCSVSQVLFLFSHEISPKLDLSDTGFIIGSLTKDDSALANGSCASGEYRGSEWQEIPMLAYTVLGGGPLKVFVVHGWFGDHRIFSPMFDALDTERFTYVFPDIRGYGRSKDLAGVFPDIRGYGRSKDLAGDFSMGETLASAKPWFELFIPGFIRMRKLKVSRILDITRCRKRRSIWPHALRRF